METGPSSRGDAASAAGPSLSVRVLRYLGQVASDIHQGMIAGLDALWYG